MINSLLEASSQSEEDYSKLCSSRKESCAKDSYQNKTSYSFEENDSDLHSGSFSIGTPSERNYESHTNYEFESVDPNEHLFSGNSLDSNIEALTVRPAITQTFSQKKPL